MNEYVLTIKSKDKAKILEVYKSLKDEYNLESIEVEIKNIMELNKV